MKPPLRPGVVVLYNNTWDHSSNGRPHIVLMTEGDSVLLCPLTSTGQMRHEAPLPAGAGGLRKRSWVAAVDYQHRKNNLVRVHQSVIHGSRIGRLTVGQFQAVQITVVTQVKRQKRWAKSIAPK